MPRSEQKYIARAKCSKDGTKAAEVVGYVSNDGKTYRDRSYAMIYDSEAAAWSHLAGADLIGRDEDGDWCWVEEADAVPARVLLVKAVGEEPRKVQFKDFAADNDGDPCVAEVRAAKVGDVLVFGGGAAPLVKVMVLS